MSAHKRYRQGQILKLVSGDAIGSQDELRKRLAHLRLDVTQATLSRDLREMRLVKTAAGYKPLTVVPGDAAPLSALARALSEFLSDVRPAGNMLVLKAHPESATLALPCGANVPGDRGRRRQPDPIILALVAAACGRPKTHPGASTMTDPRRVAVVGVTGYAGFELARLLLRHPKIDKPTFYLRDGSTLNFAASPSYSRGFVAGARHLAVRFPWKPSPRAVRGPSSSRRRMRRPWNSCRSSLKPACASWI